MKGKKKKALAMLVSGDLTLSEIAQSLEISEKTLYNWRKDPDFEQEYNEQLNEIERRIKRRIRRMVDTALTRQELILEKSRNDNAAAIVAKDVLDRAGYAPDNNVNINGDGVVQIINDIPRSDADAKSD